MSKNNKSISWLRAKPRQAAGGDDPHPIDRQPSWRLPWRLPLVGLFWILRFSAIQAQQLTENDVRQIAALMERGDLSKAEARLEQAVKAAPDWPVAYRLLGIVYQRENKLAQAEAAVEKAAALTHRTDPQTLLTLLQTKFALKKTREALSLVAEISALAKNDPRAHYALGHLLRENSFPVEAAHELEKARALDATNPAIAADLVIAYLNAGRGEQAEAILQPFLSRTSYEDLMQAGATFGEARQFSAAARAFERAVGLHPGSYDALFDLAFACYHQGELSKASASLDRIGPGDRETHADYHYLRGKIALGLHQVQAAGEEYLKALREQSDNESLCVEAGLLFFQYENFWKALDVFEPCARRLPGSSPVETGLGLSYFRLGKYTEAAAALRKVLALRPEADAAREALAFLLYNSGSLAQAQEILEQRLGGEGADFYLYYLHALVLAHLDARGNRPAALHSLDEALRRNPKFAPAYFERGRVWGERGDTARALADFETAARLDPSYAAPYYPMAQIYYKLGRKLEAEQARRRFASVTREREEKEQERQVEVRLIQSLQ